MSHAGEFVLIPGEVLCKSLDRGVPMGQYNPYPILDDDQLDFATLC